MRSKRIAAALIWSTVLAASGVAGCGKAPIAAAPPIPVTVKAARPAGRSVGGAYSANIVAETQVDAAFKVNGYVQAILQVKGSDGRTRNVQAGDTVNAGVVLATVKDDTYRQQMLRAQSEVQNARAKLTKAKADFVRYQQLLAQHVVAKADYDASKQQAESAQASVDAAQAAAQQAQVDLDDCKLKAPMKGLVLDRKIEVGTLVAANTVGFQIGDTSKVKVVFGVPGSIVGQIRQGAEISITTDAFPGQSFKGAITKIAAVADPSSRVFDIEATIPNPDGRLRVGMIAGLHLPGNVEAKSLTVVPMRAVVRPPDDPTGYAVYVIEKNADGANVARLKPVVIGPVVGDEVSVESGLDAGVKVIVKGADIVADGQVVSIVP